MPRWRVAAGSLAPLLAIAIVVLLHGRNIPPTLLLLASVAFAYLFAGLTAGTAALVLACALFDLVAVPIRTAPAVSWGAAALVSAFGVAGGAMLALLSRLRAAVTRAERARADAERQTEAMTARIKLIGPMLDAAPIGFALLDTDLRYQYVNNRLAEINGIPAGDHIGRRVAELFGPEVAAQLEAPLRAVLRTGEPDPADQATVTVDGRERHFIGARHPVPGDDGRLVGVIITVLEVTEQVRLHRELIRTAAELTATIESSPVATALLDTDLRYQQANSAYRTVCGPDAARQGAALADDALPPGVLECGRQALDGGRPVDIETTAGARNLSVSCYPVRRDDEVIGVALLLADTTERRRLAQLELETASLRATAELAFKLEEAQRLAGFASWEYDVATGTYSFSRQLAAILDVPGPVERMADVGAHVHPDDLAAVRAARDALVTHHRPFTLGYRLVRPDGKVLDVLSTGEAYRDESGAVVRLWGTIQDVTGQRAAERAARDAVRHAEQARADLEVEHQALQMFQRAMLPAELPRIEAVDLSAVYLPVAERIDIGGDWYDAFVLPDGRLALAVGDVTGHDLRAATVMGQVRNAVRAYATEHADPGTVLGRVNTLLARLPDLDLVTMLFGVYDPVGHELVWSNAGHPAPLLRRGATVSALTVEGGLLLGVVPDAEPYPEHRLQLAPGDCVLWYTDGIVDHRAIDPVVALDRLCRAFGSARGDADHLLGAVSADLLVGGDREDDVCMLVLRRSGETVQRVGGGAGRGRTRQRRATTDPAGPTPEMSALGGPGPAAEASPAQNLAVLAAGDAG